MKKIKPKHIVTFVLIAVVLELIVLVWDVLSVIGDPEVIRALEILG